MKALTARQFAELLAAWLIESLYSGKLDTETAASVRRWMVEDWFGQPGPGECGKYDEGYAAPRRWAEVHNQYTGERDYDLI